MEDEDSDEVNSNRKEGMNEESFIREGVVDTGNVDGGDDSAEVSGDN